MAIDNNSLCYLFDSIFQVENVAGRPVVGGHIEVFVAGTDQKYITWQNFDGTKNPFKIPLNNDGRAVILVEPHYTYDIYIYDSFNNMICSRLNVKPAIGGDVTVYGLTQVWHDESMSGEGTPQSPLSVVSAGKVYTGIEPIVVNNIENKISANHIPLGVQDPLYFVEDSETACIIGMSGGIVPEGTMVESSLGFENNKITGYNGSAFSAGNKYEAGSYIDITDNTLSVTGLPTSADVQNIVDVATSGLMPSGDYLTKESADTLYAPTGNYLTGLPDDLVYTADITGLATTAQLDEKLDKSDSANFYPMDSNPSGYINELPSDLATTGWVDSQGYLTSVDIPESATWNATTQTVSANSAQWAGGTANPQIPVTSTSGISIFESGDKVYFSISADYALTDDLTGKQDSLTFGYKDTAISSIDESAIYDNSAHARINTLAGRISDLSSNKLDTTAINTITGDNGEYIWTAITGIDNVWISASEAAYATRASTAQNANRADNAFAAEVANNWIGASCKLDNSASANFYTTANESGFITGVDLSDYVVKSAFDELKSSYDALSSLFSTYSSQWLLA